MCLSHHRFAVCAVVLACGTPAPSGSPAPTGEVTADTHAGAAAHEAMARPHTADAHLQLTPQRAPAAADSARAARLVATMRGALARFADVRVAEAEGYARFLPGVPQDVYHYTNWRHGLAAGSSFDPARPTSLLYQDMGGGRVKLVGAMFTAPARATPGDLDERVPLSVARWHLHVNWCVPPRGAENRWTESRAGVPVFGPRSPIATAEACAAVNGRFLPRIFGWMVHVNAFADDPGAVWGELRHTHH